MDMVFCNGRFFSGEEDGSMDRLYRSSSAISLILHEEEGKVSSITSISREAVSVLDSTSGAAMVFKMPLCFQQVLILVENLLIGN